MSVPLFILAWVVIPLILLYLSKLLWKVYLDSFKDDNCKLPLPPGSYGWPFIGNSLALARSMKSTSADYYTELTKKYGPVYKSHLFGKPMVRVRGESLIGSLMVKDHTNFGVAWMKNVKELIGPFALTNTPLPLHKERRNRVKQAFTPDALEDYTKHLRQTIEKEVKQWTKQKEIMTYDAMETLAFSAACEIIIGLPIDLLDPKKLASDFNEYLNGFFTLPLNLPGTPFNKGIKARKSLINTLHPFIQDLITGNIKRDGKIRSSGLDFIMSAHRDNEDTVTESEIADRILELLFAGHKTVASAATSLVMFLGQNPGVAHKIEKELEENDIQNISDFTYLKISTLPYLGDVIKETLRMQPPAGAMIRQASKTLEVGGYQIPAGWLVACSIKETHDFDDTWDQEDRDKFKPDRWKTLDKPYRTRYGFIPFGVGPRICIGRTYADIFLRVLAIYLVWECDIELKNPNPFMKRFPIRHPADHLPATFVSKP
uniref:Cytochrome P450 26 n=1 Tax=Platynereis dumerilii TaxID=6359 RepID=A0A2R4A6R6_PLADU|nr:cytochrome P450 26 [Platynereis dumerilii]